MTRAASVALSDNALRIWRQRYLEDGETIEQRLWAVAGQNERYYELMRSMKFLPNSPTIFNAGRNNGCTMSACVPDGETVLTDDGPMPVEAVAESGVGMYTHRGNRQATSERFERQFHGEVVVIKPRGLPALRLTGEHPIYVVPNPGEVRHFDEANAVWLPADRLRPGDFVLRPNMPVERHNRLDENQAWLVGLFAADGSFGTSGGSVHFHLNNTTKLNAVRRVCETVRSCLPEWGRPTTVTVSERDPHRVDVYVGGRGARNWFEKYVSGKGAERRLCDDACSVTGGAGHALLNGWQAGDGCVLKWHDGNTGATISTALAWQLYALFVRCDRSVSLLLRPARGHSKAAYILTETPSSRHTPGSAGVWCRVSKVGREPYFGTVHNFEVPGDHSYTVGGIAVHNCFVFDVADSMLDGPRSIHNTRGKAIAVAKAGGGVGYYFGELRPRGRPVKSTHRVACGPVAVMRDYHAVAALITQGGKRDLAQMGVLPCHHEDVQEFIHSKDADPQGLSSFNISVSWTDDWLKDAFTQMDNGVTDGKHVRLWNEQVDSAWRHGCPGMFFHDAVNRANPNLHLGVINSPNPCLTGDTLVAVADGRAPVRIADLAAAGDDVPVYCMNESGETAVRLMRRPRLTGAKLPVYKITLDTGAAIRVTANHKFLLRANRYRDARYVEARNLQPGDRLAVATRYVPEATDPDSQSRGDRYAAMSCRGAVAYEHDLIAEWHHGRSIAPDEHVHHKNGDRLDNRPDNLEVVAARLHLSEHAAGLENGNSDGVSNDALIERGRALTRSLARRFSRAEWIEFARGAGLPTSFSAWRRQSLGDIVAFAKRCAELEGVGGHGSHNPKLVRTYQKALHAGLDAEIVDHQVVVRKRCECCGDDFSVPYQRREVCFCSRTCVNRRRDTTAVKRTHRLNAERRRQRTRAAQLDVYERLRRDLGRTPQKKEWMQACKTAGVSAEIGRRSSPFTGWQELLTAADVVNHKVVRVEPDGHEDVYNGTVDDFHNFFVGGWDEGLTEHGRRRYCFLINRQCGETPNRDSEPCSLGSIVLWRFVNLKTREIDWTALEDHAYQCLWLMDDILDRNEFPHPDITKAALLTRKLGLGVMGWADLLALLGIHYDSQAAVDLADELMGRIAIAADAASRDMARDKGPYPGYSDKTNGPLRRNETTTSIAPTGTIALLSDCYSSIEPYFAREWQRTTKEGIKLSEGTGFHVKRHLNGHEPKIAAEVAPEWHVRHQAAFQKHTELGVSKTINLSNSATREDVSRIYRLMYETNCKGGTVFRDGCRDEQVLVAKKTSGGVFSTGMSQEVPKRRRLPAECQSLRKKFAVGEFEGYLHVGLYEDGTPGEIFISTSKEGSAVRALLDAWAINFSFALQHGTPLEQLCRKHVGMRFEPAGPTGVPEVPLCTSVLDFVARWLEQRFVSKNGEPASTHDSGVFCPECGRVAVYQAGCLSCPERSCGWSRCG